MATTTTDSINISDLAISSIGVDYASAYPSTSSGTITAGSTISNTSGYIYTSPNYTTTYTMGGMTEEEVKTLFKKLFQEKEKEFKKELENSYISMVGDYFWVNYGNGKCVVHVVDRTEDGFIALCPIINTFEFTSFSYDAIESEATLADWVGQEKEIYKKHK